MTKVQEAIKKGAESFGALFTHRKALILPRKGCSLSPRTGSLPRTDSSPHMDSYLRKGYNPSPHRDCTGCRPRQRDSPLPRHPPKEPPRLGRRRPSREFVFSKTSTSSPDGWCSDPGAIRALRLRDAPLRCSRRGLGYRIQKKMAASVARNPTFGKRGYHWNPGILPFCQTRRLDHGLVIANLSRHIRAI